MWNESVWILRLRGIKQCVYGYNAEFSQYFESSCKFLGIRGMKLSLYIELNCPYAENTQNARKFEYLRDFNLQILNILGAQMGSSGRTSLKQKISCKCTFKVERQAGLRKLKIFKF
jgi:hypothetical protein